MLILLEQETMGNIAAQGHFEFPLHLQRIWSPIKFRQKCLTLNRGQMYIHWIAQFFPVILIRWIVIYPVKSIGPEYIEEYVRVENFARASHAEQVQAGTKGLGHKTTKKSCRCFKSFRLSFKTF